MTTPYNRYDRQSFLNENHRVGRTDVRLIVSRGLTGRRIRHVVGPIFTLGAAEVSDLILGDQQFAELHCYLCLRDETITIRQVSDGPLITINGRALRWGEIIDGDRIRTGPYEFLLRVGQPESIEEAWPTPSTRTARDQRSDLFGGDRSNRLPPDRANEFGQPAWRGTVPRWRSVTTDKGFSIRAK